MENVIKHLADIRELVSTLESIEITKKGDKETKHRPIYNVSRIIGDVKYCINNIQVSNSGLIEYDQSSTFTKMKKNIPITNHINVPKKHNDGYSLISIDVNDEIDIIIEGYKEEIKMIEGFLKHGDKLHYDISYINKIDSENKRIIICKGDDIKKYFPKENYNNVFIFAPPLYDDILCAMHYLHGNNKMANAYVLVHTTNNDWFLFYGNYSEIIKTEYHKIIEAEYEKNMDSLIPNVYKNITKNSGGSLNKFSVMLDNELLYRDNLRSKMYDLLKKLLEIIFLNYMRERDKKSLTISDIVVKNINDSMMFLVCIDFENKQNTSLYNEKKFIEISFKRKCVISTDNILSTNVEKLSKKNVVLHTNDFQHDGLSYVFEHDFVTIKYVVKSLDLITVKDLLTRKYRSEIRFDDDSKVIINF